MKDLLTPQLPDLSVRVTDDVRGFMDGIETAAIALGYRVARERDYVGEGTDIINASQSDEDRGARAQFIYSGNPQEYVRCRVQAPWPDGEPTHDTYVAAADEHIRPILSESNRQRHRRYRLSVSPKDPLWDWDRTDVDCMRLSYAIEKFESAVDTLTFSVGDYKVRLEGAFLSFHVLRASQLPGPLGAHYEWIKDELTKSREQYAGQGTLAATLSRMRKEKGAELIERIVGLRNALMELCPASG